MYSVPRTLGTSLPGMFCPLVYGYLLPWPAKSGNLQLMLFPTLRSFGT